MREVTRPLCHPHVIPQPQMMCHRESMSPSGILSIWEGNTPNRAGASQAVCQG